MSTMKKMMCLKMFASCKGPRSQIPPILGSNQSIKFFMYLELSSQIPSVYGIKQSNSLHILNEPIKYLTYLESTNQISSVNVTN